MPRRSNTMQYFRRHNLINSDAELASVPANYMTEEVFLTLMDMRCKKHYNERKNLGVFNFYGVFPKVPNHLKSSDFYIKCLNITTEAMLIIEPEYLTPEVFETFARITGDIMKVLMGFTFMWQWTDQARLNFVQSMMNIYWGHAVANAPVLMYLPLDFHDGLSTGILTYYKQLVASKAENIKYVEPKYLVPEVFSVFPGHLPDIICKDMIPHEHWTREARLAFTHSFIECNISA